MTLRGEILIPLNDFPTYEKAPTLNRSTSDKEGPRIGTNVLDRMHMLSGTISNHPGPHLLNVFDQNRAVIDVIGHIDISAPQNESNEPVWMVMRSAMIIIS
jgi:hypothetical protein